MNKVYHGSQALITNSIQPRPSNLLYDCPVVFATPLWIVALVLGAGWKDDSINFGFIDNQLTLTEMEPNAFQKFFSRPTYVYTLDYDEGDFRFYYDALWTLEMVSPNEQRPIRTQHIQNPLAIIKRAGIKMVEFTDGGLE